jgi:hypothetical protein
MLYDVLMYYTVILVGGKTTPLKNITGYCRGPGQSEKY